MQSWKAAVTSTKPTAAIRKVCAELRGGRAEVGHSAHHSSHRSPVDTPNPDGSQLEGRLRRVDWASKRALLHYSPIPDTLVGERPEIHAFLGSYLLGEAADRAGADLVLHGHAHGGTEKGQIEGGVPVRNVAQSVIRRAYALYTLEVKRARAKEAAAS